MMLASPISLNFKIFLKVMMIPKAEQDGNGVKVRGHQHGHCRQCHVDVNQPPRTNAFSKHPDNPRYTNDAMASEHPCFCAWSSDKESVS